MRKGIVFLLIFICAQTVFSQNTFTRIDTISFTKNNQLLSNALAGGINFPNINSIDLNGDGLKDLMLFDRHNNRITTYINNGSTDFNQCWMYAPQYQRQFPPISNWAITYDYNCDGRDDLFTLSASQNGIRLYRNDASGGVLQWTEVSSAISENFAGNTLNVFASGVSLPAFTDVDNDGDMDILGYNTLPDGRVAWHKNQSMELYGICDSLNFTFASACWGDFTLLIGGANSVGCFHCPCRTGSNFFNFEIPDADQSEAARRDDTISAIFPLDIDGDNDIDLLVGDIASTNSLLIVNGGNTSTADFVSQDISFPNYDTPAEFNGFHFHYYLDADNDGIKDLIVAPDEYENTKGLWLYKNNGTNNAPVLHLQSTDFLQETMLDLGENVTPALVDYDGDGLLDLIAGASRYIDTSASYRTTLSLYKNTGTPDAPAFQFISDNFADIAQFNYSFVSPTFSDLDGDGDQDLILGNNFGTIAYFINSAGVGNVMILSISNPQLASIDVGNFATPQVFDVDKDGVKDLLIGEKSGFINYFRNSGTTTNPVFNAVPDNDTLGCIIKQPSFLIDGYTSPFAYDSVGKARLMVASMQGTVDQYIDVDGNLNGCFTNSGPVFSMESNRLKFDLAVSGGDLNGDGFTDLVVGLSTGGIQIYYQYNPTASVATVKAQPSFTVFPSPASSSVQLRYYHLKENGAVMRIMDAIGKIIMEKEITSDELSLDVSGWTEGFYFFQLISEGKSTISRLSVIH